MAEADGADPQPLRGGPSPEGGSGGVYGFGAGRGRGPGKRFGLGGAGFYTPLRGGGGPFHDADGFDDDDDASSAASRVVNAFDGAAVDYVYDGGPRIQEFERPPRLQRPGVFFIPFRPTGDTAFTAEFNNGSRNAIEAEILYMACN